MSFLFTNLISVRRPTVNPGVGAQGYWGTKSADEDEIATGIPAHIEADRQGTRPGAGLPADAAGQPIWKIIFRAPQGTVTERDVLVDELGKRYQVIAVYWGPLCTTCRCQLLEN